MEYAKKFIEVTLPLEAINREAAREKSIRHGHPSTHRLAWARRPPDMPAGPFQREPDFGAERVNYDLDDLLARAEAPASDDPVPELPLLQGTGYYTSDGRKE